MRYAILILAAMLSTTGCEEATTSAPRAPQPVDASTADAPDVPVQIEECHVCGGHKIKVKPNTPRLDYEGTTYYFCSGICKEMFEKEPAKYISRATTAPAHTPS